MIEEQSSGIASDPSAPPDVVHSTEAGRLMHMVNMERSATHRLLNQIDSSVNTAIAGMPGVDGRGLRNMSTDSDQEPPSPSTPYTPYSPPHNK